MRWASDPVTLASQYSLARTNIITKALLYVLYSITHTPSPPTVLVVFARSRVVIKRERDSEFVNKASLELYHGQSSLFLLPQPVDHTKRDPPTLHTVSQRPHPIFQPPPHKSYNNNNNNNDNNNLRGCVVGL